MTSRDKAWVFVLCIVLAGSVVGLLSLDQAGPDTTPSEHGAIALTDNPPPSAPSDGNLAPRESTDMVTETTATAPARASTEIASYMPLQNAKVGEFASYAALDDIQVHYRIVDVDTVGALVEIEVYQAGKPLGLPARRMEKRDIDPMQREAARAQADRNVTSTVINAASRSWNALLYEDRWVDEDILYVRRTWVSLEAPILGILRMELEGDGQLEARLELIDWGMSGANPNDAP
ncbi:MAG: hypothetical protein GXY44_14670 [Phycisphaerales bacterium]|nr:hypothetical protein [Phycisphaerales bacterium]